MFARAAKSDEDILGALKDVLLVQIDCEKGDGPQIAEKYEVRGYPTFLVVDPAGNVTDGWIGYPGPQKWAEFVAAGGKDRRPIEKKKASYEQKPSLDLAKSLANYASTASRYRDAVEYFQKARELDPANAPDYTQEIMYSLYYGAGDKVFTADEVRAEADYAFASEGASAADQVEYASMITALAGDMDDPQLAVPYLKQALQASEGTTDEDVASTRIELEIAYALIAENDKEKALALKKSTLDADWREDLRGVNRFAYWCFENQVNLAEAEELVLAGIEKSGDDDTMRNRYLNTAAELAHLDGRNGEAVAFIQRILETDPDRGYFQRQLVRFENALSDRNGG